MDIRVKDFDDFKRPSRKPWLILFILLVGGVLALQHYLPGSRGTSEMPRKKTKVEKVEKVNKEKPEQTRKAQPRGLEKSPDSSKKSGSDGRRAIDEGTSLEKQNDLNGARRLYLSALERSTDEKVSREAEERLGLVNIALVMSPREMPEKEEYNVKQSDSIQKIAKRYGTTAELIEKSNSITNPARIRMGDRYRILRGKFSVLVSKSRNDVAVSLDGKFFKRYRCATGKDGSTPEGTFVISYKEKEPVWWKQNKEIPFGHPDNILGTRWMGLKATGTTPDVKSYGIHGTWDDSSIGKPASAGCVRMKNPEVEELFVLLPVGTPVTITH